MDAANSGWETVRRAVEYNCSLAPTTKEEAEKLYDNVYHMRQFMAGRTLWIGGTKVAEEYPLANYNCAFEAIDSYHTYHDLFYLLMVGSARRSAGPKGGRGKAPVHPHGH